MARHCELLARETGAKRFLLLPAKKLFALGVGHVRRRGLEPGSRAGIPADVTDVTVTTLNELEWRVLVALKREFEPEELVPKLWDARAAEAGVSLERFFAGVRKLLAPGGRFILDVFNPDPRCLVREGDELLPVSCYKDPGTGNGILVNEQYSYDRKAQVSRIIWHYKPGRRASRRHQRRDP